MQDINIVNKILIALLIASILFWALSLTKPTEEAVQACMSTTNYSHDRCIEELKR